MKIPTVNVIMSFDSDVIDSFFESTTLSEFENSTANNASVFHLHNGPGSLFLGLTHSFGFGAPGSQNTKAPNIRLEFIDPQGLFEERMIDFSIPSMIPTKVTSAGRFSTQSEEVQKDSVGGIPLTFPEPEWMVKGYRSGEHFLAELQKWEATVAYAGAHGGDAGEAWSEAQAAAGFPDAEVGPYGPRNSWNGTRPQVQWVPDKYRAVHHGTPGTPGGVAPDWKMHVDESNRHYPDFGDRANEFTRVQHFLKYQQSLCKVPVWISYGVGDQLSDWSPPMQYSQLTKAEYDFKGDGARVLKLEYDGVGIHPDLDSRYAEPIKRLTEIGAGEIIRQGHSLPMFNEGINKHLLAYYEKLIPSLGDAAEAFVSPGGSSNQGYDSAWWQRQDQAERLGLAEPFEYLGPEGARKSKTLGDKLDGFFGYEFNYSIHETIVGTLTSYIRGCLNEENVLVLFPDLDNLLFNSFAALQDHLYNENFQYGGFYYALQPSNAKESDYAEVFVNEEGRTIGFEDFRSAVFMVELTKRWFEILGFRWTTTSHVGVANENPIAQPFDPLLWAQKQDYMTEPKFAYKLLQSKEYRANVIGNNIKENYYETLKNIFGRIAKEINNHPPGVGVASFETIAYVETDAKLLRILHKNGLIPVGNKPAYIVGDSRFINGIMLGKVFDEMEYHEPDLSPKDKPLESVLAYADSQGIANYKISPLTALKGLNDNYFKDIMHYRTPPPTTGPFGVMQKDIREEIMSTDPNIAENGPDLDSRLARAPVFALGVANPNIMSLKFDINNIYFQYLNSFGYTGNPTQMLITGVMGTEARKEAFNIFKDMVDKGMGDGKSAPGWFVTKMRPYYAAARDSKGGAKWADWEFAVRSLGIYGLEEFDRILSGREVWGEEEAEDRFGGYIPDGVSPSEVIGKFKRKDKSDQDKLTNEFIEMMWVCFVAMFHKMPKGATVMIDASNKTDGALGDQAKRFDKLTKLVLVGTIKTLPFFHLGSVKEAILRKALLYCTEPTIAANTTSLTNSPEAKQQGTWFSGMYIIQGFKHSIGPERAESEFLIVRDPYLTEKI